MDLFERVKKIRMDKVSNIRECAQKIMAELEPVLIATAKNTTDTSLKFDISEYDLLITEELKMELNKAGLKGFFFEIQDEKGYTSYTGKACLLAIGLPTGRTVKNPRE